MSVWCRWALHPQGCAVQRKITQTTLFSISVSKSLTPVSEGGGVILKASIVESLWAGPVSCVMLFLSCSGHGDAALGLRCESSLMPVLISSVSPLHLWSH